MPLIQMIKFMTNRWTDVSDFETPIPALQRPKNRTKMPSPRLTSSKSPRSESSWRSPKEALAPIHLRRQPQAWSNDSKHIALSFQTGPRTWTTTLYEWDGNEFAEVSWPRDVIGKRIEEEQAAQLKALGLPENTPRKLVYEGFTALEWVDPTVVQIVAERIDSVVLSKDQPPAELDARFSFVVKIRDPGKTEIADVTKIPGTSGYGDMQNVVEARLADEQPDSFYLVKDVEEGQQSFRLYALERFTVIGEKGDDYVVEDGCNHKGRIPRRLVHKFPSAFSSDEMEVVRRIPRCLLPCAGESREIRLPSGVAGAVRT